VRRRRKRPAGGAPLARLRAGPAHELFPARARHPSLGREVERRVLPNGLVLYLATDRSLPVFKAYALFRAGSLYEEPSKPGVAQFTASQLRAGAPTSCRSGP